MERFDQQQETTGKNMNNDKEKMSAIKEDDRKILGARLREAREYLGYSQDQVATYLDVSRSALSNMESGRRKVEALELMKLAGLYKRTVGHFTGESAVASDPDPAIAFLARKASELSVDDRHELERFADFLKARKQTQGG